MLNDIQQSGIKAVLLMAGTGLRFRSEIPKQFHRLAGKKVYLHTLETFLKSQLFDEIFLVCEEKWIKEVQQDISSYRSCPLTVVKGGLTRQESSLKGLLACNSQTKIVVIHDAVRPFVTEEILKENIANAIQFHAVDTCIPSADTLVHSPDQKTIEAIPNRSALLRGQTPQTFYYPLILKAHLKAREEKSFNYSDDCSLILNMGHPVHVIMGSEENMKVTSELDLILAEQILRLKHLPSSYPQKKQSLKGKKIAVTGGTGGIGKSLCELLKEEGAVPIPISRSSEGYSADLTSFQQTRLIFDQILEKHGPLDALVNSIGLLKVKQIEHLTPEEIDLLIDTNLTSVIYSCKCAHLKEKGHIVNIASSSYIRGKENYAIYASAKAAIVNFTQGLAEERQSLFINALVPQRTLTSMRLDNFPHENISTLLNPKEVAGEILRLLKQNSLTGSVVEVKKMR